ncbi:unnamed protein product [Pleuronectes platessa]|uniref:Uncharacterized protein n=1 Tax=Pleuronectes platessa TaxID=8262 RepID=A0A9N7VG48_PLEPL|nr:unnamed protein product [Pleuronectes platessa]
MALCRGTAKTDDVLRGQQGPRGRISPNYLGVHGISVTTPCSGEMSYARESTLQLIRAAAKRHYNFPPSRSTWLSKISSPREPKDAAPERDTVVRKQWGRSVSFVLRACTGSSRARPEPQLATADKGRESFVELEHLSTIRLSPRHRSQHPISTPSLL